MRRRAPLLGPTLLGLPLLVLPGIGGAAGAQAIARPTATIEATSDYRRRGLGWSDGRPTLLASASVPVIAGFAIAGSAAGFRGSRRHDGADVGGDLTARYRHDIAGWRLTAGVTRHWFGGRGRLDYWEIETRAGWTIGPATLAASAAYAPRQDAIGGDNLYLAMDADAGLPGTPFTLYAGVGRSSGATRGQESLRLRPDGTYRDYRIGGEYVRGALAAGLRLTATSIDRTARARDGDAGTRLAAYARLSL